MTQFNRAKPVLLAMFIIAGLYAQNIRHDAIHAAHSLVIPKCGECHDPVVPTPAVQHRTGSDTSNPKGLTDL